MFKGRIEAIDSGTAYVILWDESEREYTAKIPAERMAAFREGSYFIVDEEGIHPYPARKITDEELAALEAELHRIYIEGELTADKSDPTDSEV